MNLDAQQTAAVHTASRRALVLAGAGSGKTRVLIERSAYLVEECHVSPYEIMAFTFTRKAAGEIKARLENRIGSAAYQITLGTMHALALKMLQRFGDLIGLKAKHITVYSSWEEGFLLKDVAQEMGVHSGKAWKIPKKEIDAVFSAYYQRGIEPAEENPVRDLFHAFIARCRENNALTYGGLLVGLRLLVPTLAKYLHIRHILVDEVQDIDPLQWMIILKMEELFGADLFVVGDIDQSIYEWRGAAPKYLVDHQGEFDIYRLEKNYRSDPAIVVAANGLIDHNQDRITKTMEATRTPGRARVIVQNNVDSQYLVGLMQNYLDNPRKVMEPDGFLHDGEPDHIAILARTHVLLAKIDRLMEAAKIPHVYIGKDTALTDSEEFRRFHAFLKLIVNPYDNFSFLLARDILGVDRVQFSEIRTIAAKNGISHFQAWRESFSRVDFNVDFFNVEKNQAASTAVGILATYQWPFVIDPIVTFVLACVKNSGLSVEAYLSWLATYDIQDEIKDEEKAPAISLMTIHAAKGLEWPNVIVAGCNEGILPSKQALGNGDLEAERRLAYVAWTRAKDQLVLAVRPVVDDQGHENPMSRFIGESGL